MTKFETVKPSNRHGKKWTNGQMDKMDREKVNEGMNEVRQMAG